MTEVNLGRVCLCAPMLEMANVVDDCYVVRDRDRLHTDGNHHLDVRLCWIATAAGSTYVSWAKIQASTVVIDLTVQGLPWDYC